MSDSSGWQEPGVPSSHVVGCFWPSGRGGTGFLRKPNGTITPIKVDGASETCTMGLNDSGQIVEYSADGSGTWKAFIDLSW
jgi:hypothetical protein